MLMMWLSKLAERRRSKARAAKAPARKAPRRATFRPQFEQLEAREVMAATRPLAGLTANTLARNDDNSTPAVSIGFPINFFGVTTGSVFVNNNGNVTLTSPLSAFTPFGLTTNIGTPIIAPFFADVDTRNPSSGVVTYGTDVLCTRPVFGANWFNVGYFSQAVNFTNTFQLLIINRDDTGPGNFDIEFNYDRVQWETGDASGGTNGRGGQSVHVGYSNGTGAPGTFAELTGSGVNGALLDGGPNALATNLLLASTPGRYHFLVRNGQVVTLPTMGNRDITDQVRVFYPLRYVFNRRARAFRGNLTVLEVQRGPTPPDINMCLDITMGTPVAPTGFGPPITVVFPTLPARVQVLNATGTTASGVAFITVQGRVSQTDPLRIQLVLRNPGRVALSTFFQGFTVRTFAGTFDATTV